MFYQIIKTFLFCIFLFVCRAPLGPFKQANDELLGFKIDRKWLREKNLYNFGICIYFYFMIVGSIIYMTYL